MKRITAILLLLMLCVSISACSSEAGISTETVLNTKSGTSMSMPVNTSAVAEKASFQIQKSSSSAASGSAEAAATEACTTNSTEAKTNEPIKQEKVPVIRKIDRCVLTPADKCYLTDTKMEAYRKAMDALFAHEASVSLSDSYDDNLSVLGYIQNSPYSFVLSDYDITKDNKGMWFEYVDSAEKCTEMLDFIEREYLTLLNEIITDDMTELEKVLAVYQYFAQRISYDYEWLDAFYSSDDRFLFPGIAVYQALKNNRGVCHTYTYLCEFAFQQLGIDCIRAFSDVQDSDSSHMWLIVWIDGSAFHVDPTWGSGYDGVSLYYFGMTDEENIERGMVNNWSCGIDIALDSVCSDTRFASWHDIENFELLGNHQMKAIRNDGSTEIIDLTRF